MTPLHPTGKHLLRYENKWFTPVTWLLHKNQNDSSPCHEESFAKGSTHVKNQWFLNGVGFGVFDGGPLEQL